jgi:hypothetical protein
MPNPLIIKYLEFPSLFCPKMTRHVHPFARHIRHEALEISKLEFTGYIRPSHQTYPATQTYQVLQLDMFDAWAIGYIKGVHTPWNPNSFTSSPLHLL